MTYADDYNLRNKAIADMNDVASAVDGLLVQRQQVTGTGGPANTNSTSLVDYTGLSLTFTVTARQRIFVKAQIQVSHGSANARTFFEWTDSSNNAFAAGVCTGIALGGPTGSTTGDDQSITVAADFFPGAGTFTYKMRWRVGTGTTYSGSYYGLGLVYQCS